MLGSQAYVQGIRVWTLSDVPCSRKVVITPKGADDDKAGPSNGTAKGNPTVTPTYEIPTDSESGHKARLYNPFGCWHSCRPSMLILITGARATMTSFLGGDAWTSRTQVVDRPRGSFLQKLGCLKAL